VKKIVFVGQTPPPYGGQAIMIEKILAGSYGDVRLYHVRMAFSKDMDELGKASVYKVIHLVSVIAKIYFLRVFRNANILYYPPAGPDRVPIMKDIAILVATRWLFKKTIFHFHAGGVSEMRPQSRLAGLLFRLAYYHADCAILLSELNPPDGKKLRAKAEIIIPYGIEDYARDINIHRPVSPKVKILFVAVLKESKGVLVLLDAAKQLKLNGIPFDIEIMGRFESEDFKRITLERIDRYKLQNDVKFLGVLTGSEKFSAFRRADIFCFPTFFESETFGVVLLEAMQFSLPIVTTAWRGIPSVVKDGLNGFLVNPRDADALALQLTALILNPSMRAKMGKAGRASFVANYTLDKFQYRMGDLFRTI
jgi:glycosyltransferase involved in cell wall biosynthesis